MPSNINSIWTEARIADLVRLWSHGYSCAQIGALIGVTRNAVIGKAHRLKLPSHARANVNGQKRMVDPIPPETPRASPKHGSRPRVCQTVFKSPERKPANNIFNTPPTPGLVVKVSALTGNMISVMGFKPQKLDRQMTKTELREMLTAAVQNTAAMEEAP